ncbi:hypothetical protein RN001_010960 [Aquatica leii]|uniref:Uncharacterized protein n=1 Tax=Aquatica leii TaxID=1421715 RepID=A0AAN7P7F4_9COLE|nr:hypothetical protein RN001_010960 [Aquatica leii]
MDADNKMSHVCRTCLEQIIDLNYIELNDDAGNIKDQIVQCIPELDLSLVPNAYLCTYCAQALHNAYEFKQKCLHTEEIIRNHVQGNNTPDLDHIKQVFKPYPDMYDVAQTDLGMEIIYIKDEEMTAEDSIITDYVHSFLEDKEQPQPTESKSLNASRLSVEELRLKSQVKYVTKKEHETTFCCSQCNFKTSRSFLLKQHKVTHKPNHKESMKPKLLVPKIKHNGLKKYTCVMCPFKTSKKLILKNHQENHKEYACTMCDFKTRRSCGFSSHLKKHGVKRSSLPKDDLKLTIKVVKKQPEPITVIPENHYKCTKCNYKSSTSTSLQKHLRTHISNGFNCNFCDFVCGNKNSLFKHLAVHNTLKLKRKATVVTCPQCPYKVNRPLELKYHLTLHTGNRQFKCKLCTFNATRDYFLQKHMFVHSEEY